MTIDEKSLTKYKKIELSNIKGDFIPVMRNWFSVQEQRK